jgi:hypothetical protein
MPDDLTLLMVEAQAGLQSAIAEGAGELAQLSLRAISEATAALEAQEGLTDPVAVHVNMLRGTIAKPSARNIVHLYGEAALLAEMDTLRARLSAAEAIGARLTQGLVEIGQIGDVCVRPWTGQECPYCECQHAVAKETTDAG